MKTKASATLVVRMVVNIICSIVVIVMMTTTIADAEKNKHCKFHSYFIRLHQF